jgi:hypothetical protein
LYNSRDKDRKSCEEEKARELNICQDAKIKPHEESVVSGEKKSIVLQKWTHKKGSN